MALDLFNRGFMPAFKLGDRVRKKAGSSWNGRVVGFYRTKLTPVGYCVESERETGSVQLYPEAALETSEAPCVLCGGKQDNDLLTDICKACEARIQLEGSP